jgi:transposase
MSKMAELAYDIEQLYIEGHSPKMIAQILECPVEIVYDWMTAESLEEDTYDPYDTVNS